ncbi:hypothetical protein N824_10330 [Pedobacter sp. V48]|nr:hypothetical protein N824_10330 [Pedobacter sp. V48]
MSFLRKRAKKESEANVCLHLAGIMATPPFGTYTAPVWSNMLLLLSFLSFFLWKKALLRRGQGRGI